MSHTLLNHSLVQGPTLASERAFCQLKNGFCMSVCIHVCMYVQKYLQVLKMSFEVALL